MPSCCVPGCGATGRGKNNFHRFPSDRHYRQLWSSICFGADTRDAPDKGDLRICTKHFSSSQIRRNLQLELAGQQPVMNYRALKPDAVPDTDVPTDGGQPRTKRGKIQMKRIEECS